MKKVFLGFAGLVLSLALLAGCSSPSSSNASNDGAKAWLKGSGSSMQLAYVMELNIPGVDPIRAFSFGIGDDENSSFMIAGNYTKNGNTYTISTFSQCSIGSTTLSEEELQNVTVTLTESGNKATVVISGLPSSYNAYNTTYADLVYDSNF